MSTTEQSTTNLNNSANRESDKQTENMSADSSVGPPSNIQHLGDDGKSGGADPSSAAVSGFATRTVSSQAVSKIVRMAQDVEECVTTTLGDLNELTLCGTSKPEEPKSDEEKTTVRFDAKASGVDADGQSKSEEASERRQGGRSDRIQKFFSWSRSRTITPTPGRRSKMSTLLMQSEKGRSSFRRHTTVEALPDAEMGADPDDPNRESRRKLSRPILKTRADSARTERRGRSFFRSKTPNKRSRARSPGKRGSTRIRLARRESAEPGERFSSWGSKILSRLERDKIKDRKDKDKNCEDQDL